MTCWRCRIILWGSRGLLLRCVWLDKKWTAKQQTDVLPPVWKMKNNIFSFQAPSPLFEHTLCFLSAVIQLLWLCAFSCWRASVLIWIQAAEHKSIATVGTKAFIDTKSSTSRLFFFFFFFPKDTPPAGLQYSQLSP